MTFISILKRPAVVLREHSFALVLMSVIILMATIYPSNMARDYSESRGATLTQHYRSLLRLHSGIGSD